MFCIIVVVVVVFRVFSSVCFCFCFLSVLDIFERRKTQNTITVWPDRGALGMLLDLLGRLWGSLFGLAVVVFCIFSLVCCRFCFGSVLDTFER